MEESSLKANTLLARRLAQKLLDDSNIETAPVMIRDIVTTIKRQNNLTVLPWSFGDSTSGIQVTKGDQAFIGFNDKQHEHRKRFSVAHEIGHFVFGHTKGNLEHKFLDKQSVAEEEANRFAAELLMPYGFLKKDIGTKKFDVQALADRYNVSKDAMWTRIMECGFINKI